MNVDWLLQEGCVNHAEACLADAKLCALQVTLLPAKTCVVDLDRDQLLAFVRTHTKFYEVPHYAQTYCN